MEEEDGHYIQEDETFSDDDYSEEEEEDVGISSSGCVDKSDSTYDVGSGGGGELKQHFVAILISIIAAIITHAHIHGGYETWRDELVKDWKVFKLRLVGRGISDNNNEAYPTSSSSSSAPFAAPSMDGIPTSKRKQILDRAVIGGEDDSTSTNNRENINTGIGRGGGHEKALAFRRTRGLSFCPKNGSTDKTSIKSKSNNNNLMEMEFILPLEPSVRVLHSYYLADAFGVDSSMIYEEGGFKNNNNNLGYDFGSYTSDTILNEIDTLNSEEGNEGLTLDQVHSIVKSHLPMSMNNVNRQHLCLLHQYTLNKSSGRSIRGTTMVYDQPHVSTFYKGKYPSSSNNNNALAMNTQQGLTPASLTFTGYAAKFINLSPNDLNLYWDGGRIPSGSRAGEMHTVLVGTVRSMESIGTSSFPGHSFYVTPTYDKEHALQRWTITEDGPILYYDPLEDLSIENQRKEMDKLRSEGKWTEKQLFHRDAWMVDRSFGRDYLIKTGRVWLANFPHPYLHFDDNDDESVDDRKEDSAITLFGNINEVEIVEDGHKMHMWQTDYIDQTHKVETSNLYYNALPKKLDRLTKDDYLLNVEKERMLEMGQFQSSSLKNGSSSNDTTMSLTLKVLSCAPRVLEVKKFLSPVEVQHLIDLASGVKGDVIMERSTVSASNVKGNSKELNKKVRGGSKADARSSTGGWIHREQDVIVDTIFRRIADLLNVDEHLMRDQDRPDAEDDGDQWLPTHDRIVEAMQLLRYEPGEEYSAHHDFTYPSIANRYQPKRYATVLLYLTGEGDVIEDGIRRSTSKGKNDGLQGGETIFPRAVTTNYHDGVKVEPQSGKAVLFYNVLPDGNMDDLSQHSGGKVEKGVKYVANVWIWDRK